MGVGGVGEGLPVGGCGAGLVGVDGVEVGVSVLPPEGLDRCSAGLLLL